MSRIRSKDTGPERFVRSLLHRMGYRFTINGPQNRELPGRPDLVLLRHRAVVFVHGCFWHRHPGCKYAYTPKSRVAFWEAKFAQNRARDLKQQDALRRLGWKCIVVWECQTGLAKEAALRRRLGRVIG
jgi:DNA mismatch endonuclease, patch repair protein